MTGPAATRRGALLRRLESAGFDDVPVVNSVIAPAPRPAPLPAGALRRWWARRRRRRAERDHARHPERFRIEFTSWVSIPWRDRPVEARASDLALATAGRVENAPAWRHALLDTHRIRVDPQREAAEIACHAYRLYQVRIELGDRPGGSGGTVAEEAAARYDEARAAVADGTDLLLDRLLAFADYASHLEALAPLLRDATALHRLTATGMTDRLAALSTTAAQDELAAADLDLLAADVAALGGTAEEVVALLGRDVRAIDVLSRRTPAG